MMTSSSWLCCAVAGERAGEAANEMLLHETRADEARDTGR